MSLNLPAPIADYIEANRRLDLDGMMKHFAPDAVFTDNVLCREAAAGFGQQISMRRQPSARHAI